MKPFIPYTLLAAAAACGLAFGQAYTTPVGYETIDLPAGIEYNLVGLRLHKPAVAAGQLTSVTTNTVGHAAVNFDTTLTAGTTYVLEITSGTMNGLIQEVVSWGTASGNAAGDLVTSADLSALGVVVGDSYIVRAAPTLEEIFAGAPLLTGFTAGGADNVWIPNGLGGYTRYFKSSLAGNPWRNAATNTNTPNVPVVYQDGILIQKRATSTLTSLVVTGEVKTTPTITPVLTGTGSSPSYNLISTVYPAGSTLQNSGIKTGLLTGFTAGGADNVWVPNGTGGYVKYFVSSLAGNPWRNAATNTNVTEDVPLTPGVIIERKSAAYNVTLTPPASYNDL